MPALTAVSVLLVHLEISSFYASQLTRVPKITVMEQIYNLKFHVWKNRSILKHTPITLARNHDYI